MTNVWHTRKLALMTSSSSSFTTEFRQTKEHIFYWSYITSCLRLPQPRHSRPYQKHVCTISLILSISESFDLLSISRNNLCCFLDKERKKKLLKETKPLLFLGHRSAQHLLCIGSDPLLTRRLLILSGSNTADGAAPAPAPAAAARFFSSVSNLAVGKTSGLLLGARTPRLRTARASCVAEARRTSATTMASRWY